MPRPEGSPYTYTLYLIPIWKSLHDYTIDGDQLLLEDLIENLYVIIQLFGRTDINRDASFVAQVNLYVS